MKLIMTLLVRDEEDILAANIDYHRARGVDFFVVTDNRSEDRTAEILLDYQRQGILEYLYEPSDDYSQHAWVTAMARRACNLHGADWVINNDADEFWWPGRHDTLKELLTLVPQSVEAVVAPRSNFLPAALEARQPFYESMVIRERESFVAPEIPLPPKVCHRARPDVEVSQGNHSVSIDGCRIEPARADLSILHFPMRTLAQFENKIIKGGQAYERNTTLSPEVGWTWRSLYAQHRSGALQAYFSEKVPTTEALSRGLRDGTLVADHRLRDFMRTLVK
jgi:hypothetical protein